MSSTIHIILKHNDSLLLNESGQVFSHAIVDRDSYSASHSAARLMLIHFSGVNFRLLDLNTGQADIVDWSTFETDFTVPQGLTAEEENYYLCRNPQLYMWSHYFNEAPLWDDGSNLYYIVELSARDVQTLSAYQIITQVSVQESNAIPNDIKEVLESGAHLMNTQTFIYLDFKDDRQFKSNQPFMDTYTVFNGTFRRKQEQWLHFSILKDEYPTQEQLSQATAIILPGSGNSAYDDLPWIYKLQEFIRSTYANHHHLKFLCICFGLQITAKSFFGKVEPLEKRRLTSRSYYHRGNETVTLNTKLRQVAAFQSLDLKEKMIINTAHGDEVTEIPEIFFNAGSSATSKNEILMSHDHRIMGLQSHPEFSSAFHKHFIYQLKHIFENMQVKDILASKEINGMWPRNEDQLGRQLCFNFLKH